jgi:hypothetical protein
MPKSRKNHGGARVRFNRLRSMRREKSMRKPKPYSNQQSIYVSTRPVSSYRKYLARLSMPKSTRRKQFLKAKYAVTSQSRKRAEKRAKEEKKKEINNNLSEKFGSTSFFQASKPKPPPKPNVHMN